MLSSVASCHWKYIYIYSLLVSMLNNFVMEKREECAASIVGYTKLERSNDCLELHLALYDHKAW